LLRLPLETTVGPMKRPVRRIFRLSSASNWPHFGLIVSEANLNEANLRNLGQFEEELRRKMSNWGAKVRWGH
jgi:hypothetical protein